MKRFMLWKALPIFFAAFLFTTFSQAQSPGLIVQPNPTVVGKTFLNPNGDKYVYTSAASFAANDETGSEIPYKIVPAASPEPVGDQNNGPNGGPTDFVTSSSGNGFYTFYDGTNILFRFRVGGTAKGAKAYSVLLDTDLRIGNSGFYADPNYVTQTSPRSGNPGFELEIIYEQGKGVMVFNVDGTVNGTQIASYPENTNSQTSVAGTTTSNNADYFIDFGVPVSALGIGTQYIRLVGTTCSAPQSALNNNASDVFGIDDITHKNLNPNWEQIISVQCGFPVSALSLNGTGICVCTPRPTVNRPVGVGTNVVVTGVWNRLDPTKSAQAIVTLFKNGSVVTTTTANTGQTWSITVPSLKLGDTVYAKAQAAPEFMCLQSDPIAVTCITTPASPTVTCATDKGFSGNVPLNTVVEIFQIINNSGNITYSPLNAGLVYTDNTTNRTFNLFGNGPQTGDPCGTGPTADFPNGSYMVRTNNNGCLSQPVYFCLVNGAMSTSSINGITLTTPVYSNQTSVDGTGTATGNIITLYKNNQQVGSLTASGTTFTFSNLTLKVGDTLKVQEQIPNSTCNTHSNPFVVTCFTTPPPTINNNNGIVLTTDNAINGHSGYPGATVSLYKGPSPGTLVGTAVVASDGYWNIGNLTLAVGETYFAKQNAGCNSSVSNTVTILAPLPVCPSFYGTFTESATAIVVTFPSAFTGTVRLYHDSALLKAVDVSNVTKYSIPVNQDLITFTDKLNPGAILKVSTQTPGWGEKLDCATTVVQCDVPPTPTLPQTSFTIMQGQNVTINFDNSSAKALYSLVDNNNLTYGTSVFGNSSTQSFVSNPFNVVGVYILRFVADNIAAPACRTITSVTITVNDPSLPVRFVSTAVKSLPGGNRAISWTVAGEEGISHYQVERSNDCSRFEPVAIVAVRAAPDAIKQYSFTDADLLSQKGVCYRVKAVNISGGVVYSRVVTLSDIKTLQAQIVPNPAVSEATLYINSQQEQVMTVELLDVMGRPVMQRKVQVSEGRNAVSLSDFASLPRGHYIVRVKAATEIVHLKFVLK